MIAGAAALILGTLGGFLSWRLLFAGFPFPNQIAGIVRTESDFVDSTVENIQGTAETRGVGELEIAIYGSPLTPQYMMFVVEMPDGATLASLADSGLPQAAALSDPSGAQTGCAANPDGSSCGWIHGDRAVILGAVGVPAENLESIAVDIRAELN